MLHVKKSKCCNSSISWDKKRRNFFSNKRIKHTPAGSFYGKQSVCNKCKKACKYYVEQVEEPNNG